MSQEKKKRSDLKVGDTIKCHDRHDERTCEIRR